MARWWLVVDLLVLDVRVVESREVKISGNFLFGRHAYFNFYSLRQILSARLLILAVAPAKRRRPRDYLGTL